MTTRRACAASNQIQILVGLPAFPLPCVRAGVARQWAMSERSQARLFRQLRLALLGQHITKAAPQVRDDMRQRDCTIVHTVEMARPHIWGTLALSDNEQADWPYRDPTDLRARTHSLDDLVSTCL